MPLAYLQQESDQASLARIPPVSLMFSLGDGPPTGPHPAPWLQISTLTHAAFRVESSSILGSLSLLCNSFWVKSVCMALVILWQWLWLFFGNNHGSGLLIPSVVEALGIGKWVVKPWTCLPPQLIGCLISDKPPSLGLEGAKHNSNHRYWANVNEALSLACLSPSVPPLLRSISSLGHWSLYPLSTFALPGIYRKGETMSYLKGGSTQGKLVPGSPL